jgi:hypothetical protein
MQWSRAALGHRGRLPSPSIHSAPLVQPVFLQQLREQCIFGGNREDAEDAVQEAFLLAFIHLQLFPGISLHSKNSLFLPTFRKHL